MRKPLILLVDDDRAVLAALEAVVRPHFEPIARIEAFDDSAAVLEAVPAWEAEARPIALAVCDQRMPQMSGVELLKALATRTIATHMRSMLLTGYSDLDAALSARNEAAVDRYSQKPWVDYELLGMTRMLFARHVAESGAAVVFTFRRVQGQEEVAAALALRTRVYQQTQYKSVLTAETVPFDVDAYDEVSHVFGLFRRWGNDAGVLIGTLRVVDQHATDVSTTIRKLIAPWPGLTKRYEGPRTHPLPLMTYLVDAPAVEQLLAGCVAAGEQVVEPGRLAMDPDHRGGARSLGLHIVEGAVGFFFFVFKVEHAFLTCHPHHSRMYTALGFERAAGTERRYHPIFQSDMDCLHGRRSNVPSPGRERVLSMAQRIHRTGATCTCATFPRCLPGPYESGDFTATDLFCPLLAGELLHGGPGDEEATDPARRR